MSQENVEIVRRIYEELGQGNLSAVPEFYDPEILVEGFNYSNPTEHFVGRGIDAIADYVRAFLSEFRDYRIIGEEFSALNGDHVFVRGHHAAIGRESGVPVRDPAHALWTLREGRVVELRIGRDRKQLFDAAGLSE
ncbi:MAG: nuclear transport factor 2 family protein [Actinomycetota bacterium]|nr:nuclear transport factor 2 family protein [Actinomycetota bacterium]